MSHRKFERPRHGSLGFLPRKRCTRGHGRIKAYPKDDQSKPCHMTGFLGYKAGMTHIVRDVKRPGSKLNNKDIVEAVTIIDCPPMIVVGVVGYIETAKGLRPLATVWAGHIADDMRRRYHRKWAVSKKDAFTKYMANYEKSNGDNMKPTIEKLKESCVVIRAVIHTQIRLTPFGARKAHINEIQINGGTIPEKVDFVLGLFEQPVTIHSVFQENEMIDTIAITKGHGTQGVIKRWGVTRLPRKTHRGLRKVACIGAWHPARVQFQVARAGQMGFHHRVVMNKKVYRVGTNVTDCPANATTPNDITQKAITPMGGFPHYGTVKNDFLLLKGSVPGPKKRCITMRKSLRPPTSRRALEEPNLKFIDTSSKLGRGRFQSSEEKASFFGPLKKKVAAA
eukprot:Protomagalhaensia_wolfi_Nauph_80__2145@NODE_237_length_3080_cov_47_558040_g177_i0_p1_GENE_NODE_237_length_3080_cov_47_558040_g177_i0NODE_237_length_3080_cov_47_558040_g177_i0_p1_ORF_typecomplete_len394_score92_78Ribosomal_L3/PF00297_22/1_3e36_NODE_237_length_3080_cov_47_558040_g177_i010752256